MQKIKAGDEVIVLSGADKGRTGRVLKVLKGGYRFLVEGVRMMKKHVRPNPHLQQAGGIISKEAPIHRSNVAIYNAKTGKADRVGIKTLEDGTKVRYFKSTDESIDV